MVLIYFKTSIIILDNYINLDKNGSNLELIKIKL